MEKTRKVLSEKDLNNVCNTIIKADKIIIIGLGNSSSVAADIAHKLLRLGLNAVAYTDNHMQSIAISHLKENDFVIAVSHSGSSKDIIECLKLAKSKNVKTAGITNYGRSPLIKFCDFVLNPAADEINYTILGLNSRISQLAIIDCIYYYLVSHMQSSIKSINETEQALKSKKY